MRGLLNLGNTCFFNTAVQCLAHVPPLTKHFFSEDLEACPCQVTREYQNVARQLFLKDHADPVDPSGLLSAFRIRFPNFANANQHDAQEVIVLLIDIFEQSLGREFIREIFNGTENQETVFPGGRSNLESEFTTLLLDVTEPTSLGHLLEDREKHRAIKDYTDAAGKTHHVAAVQTCVKKWPKVLSFSFSMYDYKFPIEIPNEFKGKKLFACVLHAGIQQGGHYALMVRRWDKWYIKDDETVNEITPSEFKGPFYMAWYR